jgi:hypothetical protein
MSLSHRGAEYGIDETGRARLSRLSHEVYCIVNNGRGGDAVEVQKLIEAQSQDMDHIRVEFTEPPTRKMFDQIVDGALKAKRARDNFRRKRLVTLVDEVLAASCQRGWEVGPAVGDRAERMIRSDARRADHGVCAVIAPEPRVEGRQGVRRPRHRDR